MFSAANSVARALGSPLTRPDAIVGPPTSGLAEIEPPLPEIEPPHPGDRTSPPRRSNLPFPEIAPPLAQISLTEIAPPLRRSVISEIAAPFFGAEDIPSISASATSASLDDVQSFPRFMRTVPTDEVVAQSICQFWAAPPLSFTRAFVLYVNDPYGSAFNDATLEKCAARSAPTPARPPQPLSLIISADGAP